ncbi:16S rRNA (cytidine(1402)-2'-O)-methyltransferase [Edaphobacillus lindanitolerans]|uniref:Ribosomal RNA small subunit methyltransferase I n=1 Tax=Edaphobacillus lindanitolerans TaxID=550447 RepID=A0A1U7PRZ8_9BACI|nr:16S rRNA (cytidine(1402)-2'-O)-methyltransferase [Edaphobacillus lindanitolerans]SIT93408.1 16S rRNA (cytidine1402-2'-O)-methyltransferase [Edaphobacillus lindanitolerans]
MKSQRSVQDPGGKLYLVATPIGNLEDMTYRAIRVMQESAVIAAEDTRNTKKLCTHFSISTPLISYHEHNLSAGGDRILGILEEGGDVALVSDAGMPCISDPGADIAARAIEEGYAVVPVPGANAALSALIASGLPSQPFLFHGFPARKKADRKALFTGLAGRRETIIFYESPHRLKESLRDMEETFGPGRRIAIVRELTKKFEEILRGTVGEAAAWAAGTELKGEFCLVVEGTDEEQPEPEDEWWSGLSAKEHVEGLMDREGLPPKEAVKAAAKARGEAKRDVYRAYHLEE